MSETLKLYFSVRSELGDGPCALFPHVSTRNVKVEVNFGIAKGGEEKEAFKEVKEGFVMAGKVDASDRVRGMAR